MKGILSQDPSKLEIRSESTSKVGCCKMKNLPVDSDSNSYKKHVYTNFEPFYQF